MKERDRLLEQTLAFVQGVAAQRPDSIAVAEIVPPAALVSKAMLGPQAGLAIVDPVHPPEPNIASAETDALISLMALSQPATSHIPVNLPPEQTANAESPHAIRVGPQMPLPKSTQKPRAVTRPIEMALPERDVIAQRVARFRAGQQKFIRERDDNYANVQAKIRAKLTQTLWNEPSFENKPSDD